MPHPKFLALAEAGYFACQPQLTKVNVHK